VGLQHRLSDDGEGVGQRAQRRLLGGSHPLLDAVAERLCRIRLDHHDPERRPSRRPIAAVEQPHGKMREHAAVDDHVLVPRRRALVYDGFEDDRDRHAHADRVGDLQLVGVHAEVRGVLGQDQHPPVRQIRGDHGQPVPLGGVLGVRGRELPEPRAASTLSIQLRKYSPR
jgi:hypothetical protein